MQTEEFITKHNRCEYISRTDDSECPARAGTVLVIALAGLVLAGSAFAATTTSFKVPDDTWGQTNPNYCSFDGNISKILCVYPDSKGGSCYGIAALELRWYRLRQICPILPRLRTVYNSAPSWVQKYTAGLVQDLSGLKGRLSTLITSLENGIVQAQGVCDLMKKEISAGRPAMVIQKGKDKGKSVGHALVVFGFSETSSKVLFMMADPNYPNTAQTMTFDKATKKWSYYWGWTDFKVGVISLPNV